LEEAELVLGGRGALDRPGGFAIDEQIAGIDTRRLTRILREKGAQGGALMAGEVSSDKAIAAARFMTGSQLGSVMSVTSTSPTCTRAICEASLMTLTTPAPIFCPIARPEVNTLDCSFRR